jgi:hypothetical protein
VERAADVLAQYDAASTIGSISDILELHNARLFAENNLFPASYSDSQRAAARALIPELRKTVAKFFNALNDANLASMVIDVDFEYHGDLLELLAQYKVYDRCAAGTALSALERVRIGVGGVLASQRLVRSYDQEVRGRLVSEAVNGEHLIRKYLEKNVRQDVHLPASLTRDDERALLNAYLDSDEANPNFVELISLARLKKDGIVDAKMKLKAKRKHARWTEEFFKTNTGIKTGCEVAISPDQAEPVEASRDGFETKLSYSLRWLEDNLDYPTILNNFIYLFEFTDRHMLLTLPSYPAELGVFERFLTTAGQDSYAIGAVFRFKEQTSFLQTMMYDHFLRTKEIELESVIAWFFADYLKDQFGVENFKFVPSSRASTYLEKCRHLFAEMESVVKQFSLYVDNGELDTDLLAIASEQVRYKEIPSLMIGKYVYPGDHRDIRSILHLVFSDQSHLTYIREGLQADDLAKLLINNDVSYGEFRAHQAGQIDYLIQQGVLRDAGRRVEFVSAHQFWALKALFDSEAASYYHYPIEVRASIDEMVAKGWLVRRASLLSEPETSYLNYYLNQAEFSNGPNLRNKYLHGSHAATDGEDVHSRTYIIALKLLIALVIKMNDDFWLQADDRAR